MYWLTRIGLVDLPKRAPVQEHTVARTINRQQGLTGTVVHAGSREMPALRAAGVLLSADQYKALRALVGTLQAVYRLDDETGHVQWVWAWLRELGHTREAAQFGHVSIGLEIVPATGEWRWRGDRRGDVWELDDGETLDTGLVFDDSAETWTLTASVSGTENVIAVPNSGNLAVTDGRWVLTAVGETVTQVAITTSIGTVSWSGDLDDGETLIIDGGAYEITADGVLAFGLAALPLGSTDFSRIAPGGETVTVKVWANASTGHVLTFEGYDAWA